MAPATKPATPATRMPLVGADEAATPSMRLAVETMASSAPSTPARNQPARLLWCNSARSVWDPTLAAGAFCEVTTLSTL